MSKKEISKPRLYFRRGLLALLGVSFVFFATMVTLRLNRSLHWDFVRHNTDLIFHYDVLQNQTLAYFSDAEARHKIAAKLIKNTFFSPIYQSPGLAMMKENADQGHAPSQVAYGDYLVYIHPTPNAEREARRYFEMAAAQHYPPAEMRLSQK